MNLNLHRLSNYQSLKICRAHHRLELEVYPVSALNYELMVSGSQLFLAAVFWLSSAEPFQRGVLDFR